MTQFSLAELFGVTIRESANDGSDFTNPSADYRRLFLGEDGLLHVKDSAGTVTSPYTGGGGSANTSAKLGRTAGDLTMTNGVTTLTELSSTMRQAIAAAAGDILLVSLVGLMTAGNNGEAAVSTATIVSGSIVNHMTGGTRLGAHGYAGTNITARIGGTVAYVVQSGDISGGNVTISPTYVQTGSGNGTVYADATYALTLSIVNLHQ